MSEAYLCWKCGTELAEVLKPLPRNAECPQCRAQLHVCRMCEFFDPSAGQQCREPVAEAVRDKQRANFCGYFQISAHAYGEAPDRSVAARRELDALFGGKNAADESDTPGGADTARQALEDLFKK